VGESGVVDQAKILQLGKRRVDLDRVIPSGPQPPTEFLPTPPPESKEP